ncbi:DNA mismatch repair endonuclease MutL [Peptococcaceae bacterium 1198_IL3148]
MPKIKVLDQQTANKIAAGEVVERPFSVVKELVENALDSGATRISIDIKDGGITSITVSDNGCGIEPDDAALAFLRHATSKINKVEDLFHVATLGFRGEALPSIAAVSLVTMVTRTQNSDGGTKLELEGGQIVNTEPVGCPPGTSITIKDLFFNTPARKKHLKSAAAETAMISDLISRLALSRPDVNFKLISQNRILLETPGNGKLLDTIAAVNGVQMARKMLPIEGQGDGIFIGGYVGKPELNRATRTNQTLLVNGRYVKSKIISDALQQAYFTLLSSNRYPVAVLTVEIDPTLVDVNVHPAKMEVRISKERELCQIIIAAVKKALRTVMVVPQLEQPVMQPKVSQSPVEAKEPKNQEEAVFKQTKLDLSISPEPINPIASGQKKLINQQLNNQTADRYETANIAVNSPNQAWQETKETYQKQPMQDNFPDLLPIGQLLPTYILCQGPDGLYIIDQHAAHERVLYEYYSQQQDKEHDSQMLLVPVVLELNHHETQILTDNIIAIRQVGFIIEHFGGNNYLIRGVPNGFPAGEEAKFFFDILDTKTDYFHEKLAASLACRNAIKAGQKLSTMEMENLINQIKELSNPFSCPHGRPTIIRLTFDELIKRFKR